MLFSIYAALGSGVNVTPADKIKHIFFHISPRNLCLIKLEYQALSSTRPDLFSQQLLNFSMPPKSDALIALFKSIGLTQSKAAEAAKSPKSAATLKDLIHENALIGVKLDEKHAGLVAAFAVKLAKSDALKHDQSSLIIKRIVDGGLKSVDQVSGTWLLIPALSIFSTSLHSRHRVSWNPSTTCG
jgi:hypothetical protein